MTDLIRKRKPEIDARIERQIITGMIISDKFLREVQPLFSNKQGLQADFSVKVADWCLDYFDRYKSAPGKSIEDIFLSQKKNLQEDVAGLIEQFLTEISEEHERAENFNADYILDKTEEYFRLCALKKLQKDLLTAIVGGRIEEGEAVVKGYQRPQRPQSNGVDPLRDAAFISNALSAETDEEDVVLRLPGVLGQVTGPLERGFLVAFQAESSVGKTWWLWFIARLAVMEGYNVVFISLEMSVKKMTQRIWQDITGIPVKGDGKVLIPIFDCQFNQRGECKKDRIKKKVILVDKKGNLPLPGTLIQGYNPCSDCRHERWDDSQMATWWREENRGILDSAIAVEKMGAMSQTGLLKKAGKFHLVEFPADQLTVDAMTAYLNNLEYYDGFVPDVLITDYADKLKWDVPGDPRNSIGRIWTAHKGLAQQRHMLCVTASQSNTERSGKRVGKASWAETIEKRRGIDLGIALNQKDEDYDRGLMFVSVDKMRHGERVVTADVAVLQQLAIGRPYIDSCLVKRVFGKK